MLALVQPFVMLIPNQMHFPRERARCHFCSVLTRYAFAPLFIRLMKIRCVGGRAAWNLQRRNIMEISFMDAIMACLKSYIFALNNNLLTAAKIVFDFEFSSG